VAIKQCTRGHRQTSKVACCFRCASLRATGTGHFSFKPNNRRQSQAWSIAGISKERPQHRIRFQICLCHFHLPLSNARQRPPRETEHQRATHHHNNTFQRWKDDTKGNGKPKETVSPKRNESAEGNVSPKYRQRNPFRQRETNQQRTRSSGQCEVARAVDQRGSLARS
jgi:hypothetical protein